MKDQIYENAMISDWDTYPNPSSSVLPGRALSRLWTLKCSDDPVFRCRLELAIYKTGNRDIVVSA